MRLVEVGKLPEQRHQRACGMPRLDISHPDMPLLVETLLLNMPPAVTAGMKPRKPTEVSTQSHKIGA